MSKKTYQEIFDFMDEASRILSKTKEETKLKHAIHKMVGVSQEKKRGVLSPIVEEYFEKINDLEIEFCSVNEDGHILKDNNGKFIYTKESLRAMNKKKKALLDEVVEFKPFLIEDPSVKEGLTETQIERLTGFVF